MSGVDYEIKFFGWAYNEAQNNDKIWGWVEVSGKLYNFWGRRAFDDGKKLSFKRHDSTWGTYDLKELTRKKQHPGGSKTPYRAIDLTRTSDGLYPAIEGVYKGFGAHFKKQLMLARLTGTVRNEAV